MAVKDDIPHAVLSEQFQERMSGRRLRSAVFLTYQFDPGFFEQEVLPVFVDIPLSHATPIRLIQLEDALRELSGQVAVYYDAHGLVVGDAGSAKLDIRRIPVQHRTGIFHPKDVFLLVESEEPDDDGYHAQSLIVASLSANLTRSGWWENVEACHIEEIEEGDKTRLKEDIKAFLEGLIRKASADKDHDAIRKILVFLRETDQRFQRSGSGHLHSHFYAGPEPIVDFLEKTAGNRISGAYLEIISPYFDDAAECKPLLDLIDRFEPKEVRVYLPRSASGEAQCREDLFHSVRQQAEVRWGRLPKDIVRLGRSEEAGERFVHAKVYRFFTQNPKREICFIGSANLTSPAHQRKGNVETGFLVEREDPPRRPEFWLTVDDHKPTSFRVRKEDEAAASGGTRLNLRYHWDQARGEAFWDDNDESPELRLEARGIEIGIIPALPPRAWGDVSTELAQRIRDALGETSLFTVHGDGEKPAVLLVQEDGMSHKPSLLFSLSAADILRYWSLLTQEQRAAFLEARAPEIAFTGQGADLITKARIAFDNDTLFDRFAGVFHAFACLERAVRSSLKSGHKKDASYRIFGKKYDSLGSLLDRVASESTTGDDVDRYVIVMCARQLCRELERADPEYWKLHSADVDSLEARFHQMATIRQSLLMQNSGDFAEFLDWFDQWFLKRATPVLEAET